MSQKKTFNRAVKDDHFDVLVSLDRRDSLVELWNSVRTKDIQRRVIDRNPPINRRSSRQENLFIHDQLAFVGATI